LNGEAIDLSLVKLTELNIKLHPPLDLIYVSVICLQYGEQVNLFIIHLACDFVFLT